MGNTEAHTRVINLPETNNEKVRRKKKRGGSNVGESLIFVMVKSRVKRKLSWGRELRR